MEPSLLSARREKTCSLPVIWRQIIQWVDQTRAMDPLPPPSLHSVLGAPPECSRAGPAEMEREGHARRACSSPR